LDQSQFNNIAKLKLLLSIERIGPARILNLLSQFNSIQEIFEADPVKLERTDLISPLIAKRIQNSRYKIDSVKKDLELELNRLEKMNAHLITYWDANYPKNLKKIYSPPMIIYLMGSFIEVDNDSIAVVGSRRATEYGIRTTKKLCAEFSKYGITVVSGMARGIDSVAHKETLFNNGRTIAVIGSGLDVIYPPENNKLFNDIVSRGAVISEFELGTKPDAQNFPRRNRIISGISKGTLVIETKFTGGAMQTAGYALEQNREVFAIPGNIDEFSSEGTNQLIQRCEAKLVSEVNDIFEELNFSKNSEMSRPIQMENLNFFEQSIIDVLDKTPKHIDLISNSSQVSQSECLAHLLSLELKGYIVQHPGKTFSLKMI
jgi:DNA processing protein